ncbi:MAG TPA: PAS-domain containing protein [Stellaceae bacterium]
MIGEVLAAVRRTVRRRRGEQSRLVASPIRPRAAHAAAIVGFAGLLLAVVGLTVLVARHSAALQASSDRVALADRELTVSQRDLRVTAGAVGVIAIGALLLSGLLLMTAHKRQQRACHAAEATAAAQLRATIDNIAQGIGVFGADGRLETCNDSFADLLDLPARLRSAGARYGDIAAFTGAAGTPGGVLETADEIGTAPVPSQPVLLAHRTPAGRCIDMRRADLPSGGCILTVTDVTERMQEEERSRRAQRMEGIGQLAGGMAHDFNNLLTVIIGNLAWLQERIDDPTLASRLDDALKGAERGAQLTGQMLAFTRHRPHERVAVDLNGVVSEMRTLLTMLLGAAVEIEIVTATGLWPTVADPADLENAFLNLVLNARDALGGAAGRLTIETANVSLGAGDPRRRRDAAPGDYVMLAVVDTGCGMPPETVERAFEPLFTTKPEGKGTGLGLSQVYGFVRQSAGCIDIDSEPGRGTAMRIFLPRACSDVAPMLPKAVADDDAAPAEGRRETVLVVEDDPAVREYAVQALDDLGYCVMVAGNADEALPLLKSAERIDLLFTDMVMPGSMMGDELIRTAQLMQPALPALLTSGYPERVAVGGDAATGGDQAAAGIVAFIPKPYKPVQVGAAIRRMLDGADDAIGVAGA